MATSEGGEAPTAPPPGLLGRLQTLGQAAKSMGEKFSAMGEAVKQVTEPFMSAYEASATLAESLNKLNDSSGQQAGKLSAAQEQARKLAESLGVLSAATGKIRPDIQAQIDSTLAIGEAWGHFKNQLALVGMQIVSALSPILVQLISNMHPILEAAQGVANWFGHLSGGTQHLIVAVGAAIAIFGGLMGVIGPIVGVFGAVAVAVAALGAPVVGVIAGIAAVIAILAAIWITWGDKITAWLQWLVQTVSNGFASMVDFVRSHLLAIAVAVDAWLSSLLGPMKTLEDYLANQFPHAVKQGFLDLIAGVEALPATLAAALGQIVTVVTDVVTNRIPAAFAAGWEMVKSGAVELGNYLGGVFTRALNSVLGAVQSFGQQIAGMIGSAVTSALGFFSDLWTFLSEDLPGLLAGFPAKLGQWANAVGDWAWNAVTQFIDALKSLPSYIENQLLPRLLEAGKALWRNLIHGMFEAMREGVGAAHQAVEWFEGLFGPDPGRAPAPGPAPAPAPRPVRPPGPAAPPTVAPQAQPVQPRSVVRNQQRHATAIGFQNVSFTQVHYSAPTSAGAPSVGGTTGAAETLRGAPVTAVTLPEQTTVTVGGVTAVDASDNSDKAAAVAGKQATAAGQPTGFFSQAMKAGSDALTSFRGAMVGVVGQFTPMGLVAEFLGDVFKGMQPAIDSLKAPLKLVAQLFGAALAPILKAIFPLFKLVAIAATYVGQIFFTVAGGIAKFIGGLIVGVGKAIGKIPFLGGLGKTIQKAGEGIENVGKGMQDGAKELAKGREQLQAMEFGDTADKVQKLNESLTNTPEGFKVALARFEATAPLQATLPGSSSGGSGGGGGSDGSDGASSATGRHISIGNVQIVSNDPEDIWKKLKRVIERENNRSSGSLYSPAPA
ncbi:MAG: putative rane protein [Gemmatimonadetes bacterium]|nr:putative rane protein [Gemmatimonadota bacterium]